MSDLSAPIDYAQLAQTELDLAARASDTERRRAHLDQAAIFATLDERQRANRDEGDRSVG